MAARRSSKKGVKASRAVSTADAVTSESSTVGLVGFEVKDQIYDLEVAWVREAMEALAREAFELRGNVERFVC